MFCERSGSEKNNAVTVFKEIDEEAKEETFFATRMMSVKMEPTFAECKENNTAKK